METTTTALREQLIERLRLRLRRTQGFVPGESYADATADLDRLLASLDAAEQQTNELDQAIRDVIDAVKHAQRLGLGTSVHVAFHDVPQEPFMLPEFIASDLDGEDGTPSYGHVPGHDCGFLSRLLYRGDQVLLQLYTDAPPIREAAKS